MRRMVRHPRISLRAYTRLISAARQFIDSCKGPIPAINPKLRRRGCENPLLCRGFTSSGGAGCVYAMVIGMGAPSRRPPAALRCV
jgi:hypothetical protein